MGYDDDECVFCYCNKGGNNSDCSENTICLGCMDVIVGDWATYRLKDGLKNFLSVSNTPEICRMCNKDVYIYFEAPICEKHLKYDPDPNIVYNEGYSDTWTCGNEECQTLIFTDMMEEDGKSVDVDKYKCPECNCIRWLSNN